MGTLSKPLTDEEKNLLQNPHRESTEVGEITHPGYIIRCCYGCGQIFFISKDLAFLDRESRKKCGGCGQPFVPS